MKEDVISRRWNKRRKIVEIVDGIHDFLKLLGERDAILRKHVFHTLFFFLCMML